MTGELRETTDIRVPPTNPVAILAQIHPWGEIGPDPAGLTALAISAVDGNLLRYMGENFAMPPGRIHCAVVSRDFDHARCYALIDGTLQFARLADTP